MNPEVPHALSELSELLIAWFRSGLPWAGPGLGFVLAGGGLLGGLVLMLAGGRLLPGLLVLASGAVWGGGGALLAMWIGLPLWPTIAVGAAAGLVLGWLMLDVWLSSMLGGVLALAGVSVYGAIDLAGPLSRYSPAPVAPTETALDPNAALQTAATAVRAEASRLVSHLDEQAPQMRVRAGAVAAAGVIAGFVIGLMLPKVSRAMLAATFGVLLVTPSGLLLTQQIAPGAVEAIMKLGAWNWAGVAILWLAALGLNLRGKSAAARPAPPPAA